LKEQGLNSIDEMDSVSLDKLIGFHLLYYAYSADKLINFRPEEGDDVTDEDKKINAGLYYKHRTKSKDANTTEYDFRRDQEVTAYRKLYNPEFDPYDDPYDDPTYGWMYDDGKDGDDKKGNKPDDDGDNSPTE